MKKTKASKILYKKTPEEIPPCSFCNSPAKFDSPTLSGPWAYTCSRHYKWHTTPDMLKMGYEFRLESEKKDE